jgi:hypothetical protein
MPHPLTVCVQLYVKIDTPHAKQLACGKLQRYVAKGCTQYKTV